MVHTSAVTRERGLWDCGVAAEGRRLGERSTFLFTISPLLTLYMVATWVVACLGGMENDSTTFTSRVRQQGM